MGERLCTLNQTHLACESTSVNKIKVIPPPILHQDKKKVFAENESVFPSKLGEDHKKQERSSPQFGTIFGRNLGFIRAV